MRFTFSIACSLVVSCALSQIRPVNDWKSFSKKDKEEVLISNKEYQQFVFFVADSNFRAALAAQGDNRYIKKSENGNSIIWDVKIKHTDPQTYATLDEFRVTRHESIYKRPEWNFGTLKHKSSTTGKTSWVYPDTLVWLRKGEPSTLGAAIASNYNRQKVYQNAPVVGIEDEQAKLFGEWLTRRFNQMMVSKQPVQVTCEVKAEVVPLKYYDKRPDWNITANDYLTFAKWVRDSLARLRLGEELNEIYLIEKDAFGDLDEPSINWEPIVPWGRFNDKEKEALEPFINSALDPELSFSKYRLIYRYHYFDLVEGSRDTLRGRFDRDKLRKTVNARIYPGYMNAGEAENFDWKQKNAINKKITYEQAVAYFQWRSKTQNNSKDPVQMDWIPSHQEWIEYTETDGAQPALPQLPSLSGLACKRKK